MNNFIFVTMISTVEANKIIFRVISLKIIQDFPLWKLKFVNSKCFVNSLDWTYIRNLFVDQAS
jgi:hypothetical protein